MKTPLAIVGPTASGKTPLSIELAKRLRGEVVSADSRQVYKHLTVGTSKPSDRDRAAIPHHFVDTLDPKELYSAGLFAQQASTVVSEIISRRKLPLLVGGSGLYIRAVIDGLFEGPSADPGIRSRLERRLQDVGVDGILADLERVDSETARTMKKEPKARRIIRALEVFHATGIPLSAHIKSQPGKTRLSWIQVSLDWDRKELYGRIDARADSMVNGGLIEEVQWLNDHGYDQRLNALNTVGYKEVFDYLKGVHSLTACIDLIKRNTRRFAKRQLTWFRADKRIRWIQVSGEPDWSALAEMIVEKYERV